MAYYKWSEPQKGGHVKYYRERKGRFYYVSLTQKRMAIVTTLNEKAVEITKEEYDEAYTEFINEFSYEGYG